MWLNVINDTIRKEKRKQGVEEGEEGEEGEGEEGERGEEGEGGEEGEHEAPVWIPDDLAERCFVCNSLFTLINRRHHCRKCGGVVCSSCSANKVNIKTCNYRKKIRKKYEDKYKDKDKCKYKDKYKYINRVSYVSTEEGVVNQKKNI